MTNKIFYPELSDIALDDVIRLFNNPSISKHLVGYETFTPSVAQQWIDRKLKMQRESGCRIRGIVQNGAFAGWCGIQRVNEDFELALVINPEFWGQGKHIFKEVLRWASELGHEVILLDLLQTRREYHFLKNLAKAVYYSEKNGYQFTTYELEVEQVLAEL